MNPNEIIAIVIFIAVMVAIISEKIHRATAAVAGAVLLLVTQVLTVDTAMAHVDVSTIGVLVGMMLFVAVVKNSGLFEYIAIKSAKLTHGRPWASSFSWVSRSVRSSPAPIPAMKETASSAVRGTPFLPTSTVISVS